MKNSKTQVLVVGAGPVGLLAALMLRRQGVDVRVVERQSATQAHTFPVVLHPGSLRLLDEVGLAPALFWRGRPITRLAVYADYERRAVLDLPKASQVAPGALTLPQDILRQALTNALQRSGVEVEWSTRLAVLQQDGGAAWGRLLHENAYAPADRVSAFEAEFVIGADGYQSTVREALGIPLAAHGALESFVFFDAVTRRGGSEAQLAVSEDYANAVYPLQGGLSRFSFQVSRGLHHSPDARTLSELIQVRLPWYAEEPDTCEWSGVAEFRRALACSFGRGRVWLAGESAHLTAPLGVQSLNVGLDEAVELAGLMSERLGRPVDEAFGAEYDRSRRQQWLELLGADDGVAWSSRSPTWARRYHSRLLSSLPASKADLYDLLDQLRLSPTSTQPRAARGE